MAGRFVMGVAAGSLGRSRLRCTFIRSAALLFEPRSSKGAKPSAECTTAGWHLVASSDDGSIRRLHGAVALSLTRSPRSRASGGTGARPAAGRRTVDAGRYAALWMVPRRAANSLSSS
jgi:hypothetical protein